MQEKSLRSQAEQHSIEFLKNRKDWETDLTSRDAQIRELEKKIEDLSELQQDLELELKVNDVANAN